MAMAMETRWEITSQNLSLIYKYYVCVQELDTEPTKYNVVDYSGGVLEKDSK